MTKEIRRMSITVEKHITIDVLVDKDKPDIELESDLTDYFEEFGNEWNMIKDSRTHCFKKYSLIEYRSFTAGKHFDIFEFNDDFDELAEYDEIDFYKLCEEEERIEREEQDRAAQLNLEV